MISSFAAWVGDHSELVMVAEVSYGSCPITIIPKCGLMGHSPVWLLDNSRDQHVYSALWQETTFDALHTLCVHPISDQFWQSLSAMSISFVTLMHCIGCFSVWLKTYCTGCSNTWKLAMWRINLIIDSHQYYNIWATSTLVNHSIG